MFYSTISIPSASARWSISRKNRENLEKKLFVTSWALIKFKTVFDQDGNFKKCKSPLCRSPRTFIGMPTVMLNKATFLNRLPRLKWCRNCWKLSRKISKCFERLHSSSISRSIFAIWKTTSSSSFVAQCERKRHWTAVFCPPCRQHPHWNYYQRHDLLWKYIRTAVSNGICLKFEDYRICSEHFQINPLKKLQSFYLLKIRNSVSQIFLNLHRKFLIIYYIIFC